MQNRPTPGGSVGTTETEFFTFAEDRPFELASGETIGPVTLAYEMYGELNEERDNLVLLFHALTGSHHAAGHTPAVEGLGDRWNEEVQQGWWDDFIGPGRALDTDRYCVLCVNYIGGCYGSSGPASTNPATGEPWGASFPRISFADVVRSQLELIDHLGVERLHAVIGPSTGGMACLSLSTLFPERVDRVVLVATGMETTPLQRIHNFEQVRAIENDSRFLAGDYSLDTPPSCGLETARMISHKTFVSLQDMQARSRSRIEVEPPAHSWYGIQHSLESYMLHQGGKFAQRFDANSYLRILDAWSQFDLLEPAAVETHADLFARCCQQRYLIFTISSDVCYYPSEQLEMAETIARAGIDLTHITVHSDKGHDSFLLEPHLFSPHLSFMLAS